MVPRGRGRPARGSTFEDMEDIMDTFQMMAHAMRHQAVTVNHLMERVDHRAGENLAKTPEGKVWTRNIRSLLNFIKRIHQILGNGQPG